MRKKQTTQKPRWNNHAFWSFEVTRNCVLCAHHQVNRKAVLWGGHVLAGNRKITAGLCKKHACVKQEGGLFGKYLRRMKINIWGWKPLKK